MNRDAGRFLAPLLAVAIFAFVVARTAAALQDSGVWRFGARTAYVPPHDPLADLDGLIARTHAAPFAGASRDPFGYGSVAPRTEDSRQVVRRPLPPPPPAVPVLTAIIFDADPRALVAWKDREFMVRPGGLFDDFVVESISRDRLVLKRGTESIVLRSKPQGE